MLLNNFKCSLWPRVSCRPITNNMLKYYPFTVYFVPVIGKFRKNLLPLPHGDGESLI